MQKNHSILLCIGLYLIRFYGLIFKYFADLNQNPIKSYKKAMAYLAANGLQAPFN